MSAPRAPWWMYLVAASYVAAVTLRFYQVFWGPPITSGFEARLTRGGLAVLSVHPNSAEAEAGLKVGDRVVAVNEQVIRNVRDWEAIRANIEVDRPQRWQISRAGERLELMVTVFDFGSIAETRAFLVMELLQGITLREEICAQKRLAPPRVVEIMRGVCAAVQAAHRRQLVHRDLKPENIFLARGEAGEVPKVLDFGIAKFLPEALQETADTQSGALIGTLAYMAPEQLRGQPVDPSWDLWALAVVTHEMLTGVRPFAGSAGAIHSTLVMEPLTPLAAYEQGSPARWQQFFDRAFDLDPARRPNSAQTFFSELERALAST